MGDIDTPSPTLPREGQGVTTVTWITWETEVFDKNNNKTRLYIPNTDVVATINAKLPFVVFHFCNDFLICSTASIKR